MGMDNNKIRYVIKKIYPRVTKTTRVSQHPGYPRVCMYCTSIYTSAILNKAFDALACIEVPVFFGGGLGV